MENIKVNRAQFATKLGVIAATVGSAVGLGNIWRFPYETGTHGGAAFLLIYIFFVLILGIPVMCAEFTLGRAGGSNAAGAFRNLGASRGWQCVGLLGILTSFVILGFYTVVAGWTMEYLFQSVTGGLATGSTADMHERFGNFVQNDWRPLFWTILFIVINFVIISRGVEKGIEKISNILMPILFVILIIFCVNSLFLPKAGEGFKFLFSPDFSKIDGNTILAAMGQAFFSLSIGMGVLMTYSSYFSKETKLLKTASITALLDTIVAILAGVIIFPAVFSYNQTPEAGPRLVFEVLPAIFVNMPGGSIWASLFFLLLFVATLTSTISLTEVVIAYLVEEAGLSRNKATIINAIGVIVMATLSSLSFGSLSGFTICGLTFFNLLDFISSNIMLPLGGLLICIYAGWFLEKKILKRQLTNSDSEPRPLVKVVIFLLRYVAPLAILTIFVAGLL
jgi:NSS family neurotransmitter:Na+ symporter